MDSNHDTRPKRFGWRLVARVGVVLGLLIGGGILGAGAAFAAPLPEGSAKVDCTGRVSFTSVAWLPEGWQPGDDPKPRTNAHVEVLYSFDARTYHIVPWKPTWQYNSANNFQFKDTFQLPQPVPASVIVAFKTPERWADGGRNGTHTQRALKVPKCQQQTAPVAPAETAPTTQPGPAEDAGVTAAPAVPVVPAETEVAPAVAAPAAASGGSNIAVVIVGSLIGVALVIDAIGITLFLRRRQARAALPA